MPKPTLEFASIFSMMVCPELACSCRIIALKPKFSTNRAAYAFAALSCPCTINTLDLSIGALGFSAVGASDLVKLPEEDFCTSLRVPQ